MLNELATMFNSSVECARKGLCKSPIIVIDSDEEYAKRVLRDKPARPEPRPRNISAPLKLLIFTDAHMDFNYTEVFTHRYRKNRERARCAICQFVVDTIHQRRKTLRSGLEDMEA